MGFYNMAAGDVPYFASLANQYAISDNYHQFMLGGTGPNSISIGTGMPLIYSDANGTPTTPPALQIQNPDPYPGATIGISKTASTFRIPATRAMPPIPIAPIPPSRACRPS